LSNNVDLIIGKYDETYIYIETYDDSVIAQLKKRYTYKVSYFKKTFDDREQKYKSKINHFYMCLFEVPLLPYGLLHDLKKYLTKNNFTYILTDNLTLPLDTISSKDLDEHIKEINFTYKILTSFQRKAVIKAFNKKRAIMESTTSSGKTLMIYVLVRLIQRRIHASKRLVIIIPSVDIISQTYEEFNLASNGDINFMKSVKMLFSEHSKDIEEHHKILLSTPNTMNNYSENEPFFKSVYAVIVDEAHGGADEMALSSSTKMMVSTVRKCVNAKIRVGFTGTMFHDDHTEKQSYNSLVGLLGRSYKISDYDKLKDLGFVSPVKIKIAIFDYGLQKYMEYNDELLFYHKFVTKLEYIAKKMDNNKENFILLFKRIKWGHTIIDYLSQRLKGQDKRFFYVDKDVNAKSRRTIKKMSEKGDNVVLVASYKTFGTGISINKLHNVVLIEDIKSRMTVIQGIGRGMRKHDTKKQVIVYDLVDMFTYEVDGVERTSIGYNHYISRLNTYRGEGYKYNKVGIFKAKRFD